MAEESGISPCSNLVALLLCVFGGAFGLHRFYVGKTWSGYLFFWGLGMFPLVVLALALLFMKSGTGPQVVATCGVTLAFLLFFLILALIIDLFAILSGKFRDARERPLKWRGNV